MSTYLEYYQPTLDFGYIKWEMGASQGAGINAELYGSKNLFSGSTPGEQQNEKNEGEEPSIFGDIT